VAYKENEMSTDYKRFRGLSDGLARNLDTLIGADAASKDSSGKPTISAVVTRADGSKYEVRITRTGDPIVVADTVEMGVESRQRDLIMAANAERASQYEKRKARKAAGDDDDSGDADAVAAPKAPPVKAVPNVQRRK
jgi:hypothetical protein